MLIGYTLYYSTATGNRLAEMDRDVTAAYAQLASRGNEWIVQWSCQNGDSRDVRYFRAGKAIEASEAARLLGWGTTP